MELFLVVRPKCSFCARTVVSDTLWISVKLNNKPGNTALGGKRAKRDPDSLAGCGLSRRHIRGPCWAHVPPGPSSRRDTGGPCTFVSADARGSVSSSRAREAPCPTLVGAGQTQPPAEGRLQPGKLGWHPFPSETLPLALERAATLQCSDPVLVSARTRRALGRRKRGWEGTRCGGRLVKPQFPKNKTSRAVRGPPSQTVSLPVSLLRQDGFPVHAPSTYLQSNTARQASTPAQRSDSWVCISCSLLRRDT